MGSAPRPSLGCSVPSVGFWAAPAWARGCLSPSRLRGHPASPVGSPSKGGVFKTIGTVGRVQGMVAVGFCGLGSLRHQGGTGPHCWRLSDAEGSWRCGRREGDKWRGRKGGEATDVTRGWLAPTSGLTAVTEAFFQKPDMPWSSLEHGRTVPRTRTTAQFCLTSDCGHPKLYIRIEKRNLPHHIREAAPPAT